MTDTAPATMTVALWAANLARPLNGVEAWAAAVDARMAEARDQGAELLVMPEYASAQWLSFAPAGLEVDREVPWMAGQAEAALAALAPLPARHGMALLAGTMPVAVERPDGTRVHVNRAHLLLPDGRVVAQDKLCLTPNERDPAAWDLATGEEIRLVDWRGLKLATLVCLDVELPALSARLAPYAPDLLLVPSMTEKLAGHHRVHACARARAVELQAALLAVGCIGDMPTSREREGNTGGAAAYLPCEPHLGHTGVAAEVPPRTEADGPGPLLVVRDLPLAELRALRRGGAEVWPGAWRDDHVRVVEGDASGAPSR